MHGRQPVESDLGSLPIIDILSLLPGIEVTTRAYREQWKVCELARLLREHPVLEAAAAAVPLHQLRTFLQGPAAPSPERRDNLWVDGQGELWHTPDAHLSRASGEHHRVVVHTLPHRHPARVRHVAHNEEWVLLVLETGGVLRVPYEEVCDGDHMEYPVVPLNGEVGTWAEFSNSTALVLTEAGRLWALLVDPEDEGEHGLAWSPGLALVLRSAGVPVPVSVLSTGEAAPPFVLFSVSSTSLCAVDGDGQLYAAGDPFAHLLQRLPPAPAPVRSVLATGSCFFKFRRDPQTGLPRVTRGPPDEEGHAGPLALLVDGSVWALAGQQRLPMVSGVTAMVHSWEGILFTGPDRPPLNLAPHKLWEIRDWLDEADEVDESDESDEADEADASDESDASDEADRADEAEDHTKACGSQHAAAIRTGGVLMVTGQGPGSLQPWTGEKPSADTRVARHAWPISRSFPPVGPGQGQPADLHGEQAAQVWVGECWTVARTEQGSLWVWGRTSHAVIAGRRDCGIAACRDCGMPTRVSQLAGGMAAPHFRAAAAAEAYGVLSLVAQDDEGRFYWAGRPSENEPERLLALAKGAPRVRARVLLADPEPLALLEDGRVWSFAAERLLPCGDVVHMGTVPPEIFEGMYANWIKLRRVDGRELQVCSTALWSATFAMQRWHA